MQTIISKTGIEVSYPCTVHLLQNGENYECEYKSDDLGQDLLNHICRIQNIDNQFIWGLKFMDNDGMEDQRHWLDLDNLIRTQVRTVSNVRFYFRVKVYPPEPYRIIDGNIRFCFFQQLRLDLLSGRLFCSINDASMLTALILQYVHGNFDCDRSWTYNSYIKQKILRQERCSTKFFSNTKFRALDIYEKLLPDLRTHEVEDMFLRLAALILQYVHGNFDCDRSWTYNSYIKQKILRQERCSTKFFSNTKFRALDIYEKLLPDLRTHEVEDMFLRLAGKLNSYGVEPLLVQNLEREDVILWMNYSGFSI
ncbi:FERM, ARHGEF and pleckstrin domain-containing protein 1-like [Sitophilus oryzae]|uniref:FERM, ARHGEF and pleckstrin domain-containing protein 1-like n=1 Tax=Sitophilus oryzae TaxID=7048 RepID=A0A6J2XAJ7_SITOR|nr:FERM, ARHGEF and pleckstrin domain-containing protein 1-like [Sitophilus oryzae]